MVANERNGETGAFDENWSETMRTRLDGSKQKTDERVFTEEEASLQ